MQCKCKYDTSGSKSTGKCVRFLVNASPPFRKCGPSLIHNSHFYSLSAVVLQLGWFSSSKISESLQFFCLLQQRAFSVFCRHAGTYVYNTLHLHDEIPIWLISKQTLRANRAYDGGGGGGKWCSTWRCGGSLFLESCLIFGRRRSMALR
jgi:hypothetical protein